MDRGECMHVAGLMFAAWHISCFAIRKDSFFINAYVACTHQICPVEGLLEVHAAWLRPLRWRQRLQLGRVWQRVQLGRGQLPPHRYCRKNGAISDANA